MLNKGIENFDDAFNEFCRRSGTIYMIDNFIQQIYFGGWTAGYEAGYEKAKKEANGHA